MPSSSVTSKGQTTIPKPIRDHLRLQPGDRLDFSIDSSGNVQLQAAALGLGRLKGLLQGKVRRPVSVAQMNAAIRTRAGAGR